MWNRGDAEVWSKWNRSAFCCLRPFRMERCRGRHYWAVRAPFSSCPCKEAVALSGVISRGRHSGCGMLCRGSKKWNRRELEVKYIEVRSKLNRSELEVNPPPFPQTSYPTLVGLIGICIDEASPSPHPTISRWIDHVISLWIHFKTN